MIYFTSDWHIFHNQKFIWESRGFSSIEEHDETILLRCNEIVKPDDELWILGDLAMGGNELEWNRIFFNLKCQNVHIIEGNHDLKAKKQIYKERYNFIYEGMAQLMKVSKKRYFYLSHYPTIVDNYLHSHEIPMWNISGHTHSTEVISSFYPCVYNVAVDAHNCYPVSLEQIKNDILKYEGKI